MMMITSESRRCWQEHDREPSRRHCQSRRRTRACTVSTACVAAAGVAASVRDVYLAPFPTLVPALAMRASPHPTTSPIALPHSKTELPTPTSSRLGLLLPLAPLSLSLTLSRSRRFPFPLSTTTADQTSSKIKTSSLHHYSDGEFLFLCLY